MVTQQIEMKIVLDVKEQRERLNFGLSNDNNENAFLEQVNLGAR